MELDLNYAKQGSVTGLYTQMSTIKNQFVTLSYINIFFRCDSTHEVLKHNVLHEHLVLQYKMNYKLHQILKWKGVKNITQLILNW